MTRLKATQRRRKRCGQKRAQRPGRRKMCAHQRDTHTLTAKKSTHQTALFAKVRDHPLCGRLRTGGELCVWLLLFALATRRTVLCAGVRRHARKSNDPELAYRRRRRRRRRRRTEPCVFPVKMADDITVLCACVRHRFCCGRTACTMRARFDTRWCRMCKCSLICTRARFPSPARSRTHCVCEHFGQRGWRQKKAIAV